MYKSLHSERLRPELAKKRPTKRVVKCSNSALLILLTILTTALAAYLITVIFKPSKENSGAVNETILFSDDLLLVSDANRVFSKRADGRSVQNQSFEKAIERQRRTPTDREHLAKINSAASELVSTQVEPQRAADKRLDMVRFRQKLALLSRSDLLKLLKIVQIRLDNTIRKREALNAPKSNDRLRMSASVQRNTTTSMSTSTSTKAPEVVLRSDKMNKLIKYLEHLESNMPQIDQSGLERLTALDGERSEVRVIKPEVMSEVLKAAAASKQHQLAKAESPAISSWRDPVELVAPGGAELWPQEPVEDWPSGTTLAPVTQRPRKKKRKKVITTTSTTTTTTTSTTTTQAPSQAFEEVWIEEEEDIVRPPRRKTKKYKKKTSPTPTPQPEVPSTTSTTTSTTTTTTTTTTPEPVTTVQPAVIEDWPEEQWPQQEQVISTKSPKLWPEQPQQAPPEEVEKWPEEEWLNELRDDIQSRLHLVYNS